MFELNPVELNTNPGHNRFILNHIANYFNGFQLKIITVCFSQVTIKNVVYGLIRL